MTLTACGSGESDRASRASSAPADATAIRGLELATDPATQSLLRQLGSGEVDSAAILYADVTGDRREEAILPVSSGGTMGNIGYLVFRLDSGKPQVVLLRTADRSTAGGLQMSVEDGVLLETRGVYGDEDPLCCPSRLRETTFHWDGSQLQVAQETVVQQDAGTKY